MLIKYAIPGNKVTRNHTPKNNYELQHAIQSHVWYALIVKNLFLRHVRIDLLLIALSHSLPQGLQTTIRAVAQREGTEREGGARESNATTKDRQKR